ncbi:MAG TPA: amino acid racemase [Planococcus sp. (in: firmicutes)]|nr:amino acid racemase [Planococcus sp. (in: firmicutes)]
MKKLGIIGGTGPESTVDYYQSIIAEYQKQIGDSNDLPELLIYSINMYKIFKLLDAGEYQDLADYLGAAVRSLERAGADFAAIAANTPHIVFDEILQQVNIPMISIVEETYRAADESGFQKIGLLGTKSTMSQDFFKLPFWNENKEILVPQEGVQDWIHEKILSELEHGIVKAETKEEFIAIVEQMIEEHSIEAVILGCTEFPMIFKPEDVSIPLMNTVDIHVKKIVKIILS